MMKIVQKTFLIKAIFIFSCLIFGKSIIKAEPLRILVPSFYGPKPISKQVQTTLYFKLSQAFESIDIPQKGAWLLYGFDELNNYDMAINVALWPSVHSDIVLWGGVLPFDDGVIVQLYLTITPLLKERRIRPELWIIKAKKKNGEFVQFAQDIPGLYYEFEPFKLKKEVALKFALQDGIPLYYQRNSKSIKGYVRDTFLFREIYEDAIYLESEDVSGWVRVPDISEQSNEVTAFSQGLVRLFRGDWKGSIKNFDKVLTIDDLPQNLRIDSIIYKGLSKEKSGTSGRREFEAAYELNKFNRSAASYLLMSRISDITLARKKMEPNLVDIAHSKLKITINITKSLYSKNDKWFKKILNFSETQ